MKSEMNKNAFGFLKSLFVIIAIVGSSTAFAQLSGSYTINADSATKGKNYKSFNDFVSALSTGGINGATSVDVVKGSGPYSENVVFDSVKGASSTNTITINGNGEKIATTNDSFTIQMNRANYFTIKNLIIESAGTGRGIRCFQFLNGASNNTVSNCELIISKYTGTANSSAYIAFTASTTGNTAGNHGSNNTFTSNKMWNDSNSGSGPYYGIIDYRSSAYASTTGNNVFQDNEVQDVYHTYFYLYYSNGVQVLNNKIHTNRPDARYSYGIYRLYNYTTTVANKFDNNEIFNLKPTGYTYFAYTNNSAGSSSLKMTINGNKAHDNGGQYTYGFQNYSNCNDAEMNDNEIYGNSPTYYLFFGFMNYYANNCEVKRNKVYNNTPGYYLYYSTYSYACTNYELENNAVYDNSPGLGMYNTFTLRSCANATMTNNLYFNNKAKNFHNAVLYVGDCASTTIAHNTFVINDSVKSANNRIWFFDYRTVPTSVVVNNNILYMNSHTSVGNQIPIYCYRNADKIDWSNNVVYDISPGTKQYIGNSQQYNSFEKWAEAVGDTTSMTADPVFKDLDASELQPTNPTIANIGSPGLATYDFDSTLRSTCGPDPGAFEFIVNHGAANFNLNGKNECGGYSEELTFDFINRTSKTIYDARVYYSINGRSPIMETIDSVSAFDTVSYTFKNIPIFHDAGDNEIVLGIWCDDDSSDNTLTKILKITPTPYGFYLSEGSNFPGYYKGNQAIYGPDITVPGMQVDYDINNPSRYPGSSYGTGWEMTPVLTSSSGKKITSGFAYTVPTGSTKGILSFAATATNECDTIFMGMLVSDLNTGCDSFIGRWIHIPPTPKVSWEGSDGCDEEVMSFKNGTTQKRGDTEYLWDFDDPKSGSNSTSSLIDPTHVFTTPGVYNVTLTAWNYEFNKFKYSVSKKITIYANPDVCFKIKNACEGGIVEFTNCTTSKDPAAITYHWNFGDGSATSNKTSPNHKYIQVGGYRTALTATQNGCRSVSIKSANLFAEPKADFVFSGDCNLSDVSFINRSTISFGQVGYNWDFGDAIFSNLTHPKHIFSAAGNHTVTLKVVSEFGCTNSIQKSFTLKESPRADFDYDNPCNLNPTQFTHTGTLPTGNNIFIWDFNGQDQSTKQNVSYLFKTVGVKRVQLTVKSDNGCSDNSSVVFIVKQQADVNFAADDVCEGEDVVFTNLTTSSSGKLNFIWRFGDGSVSNISSPRHKYKLQQVGVTESFNVTLLVQVSGGCTDSVARTVTVNAASNPFFEASTSGRDLTVFNQASKDPINIYNWRFGDGGRSSDITPEYQYTNVDVGTFEVCLNLINNQGCASNHCQSVDVNLLDVRTPKLNALKLYPNPTNGILNLQWSIPADYDQIEIVDAAGRAIRSYRSNQEESTLTMEVGDLTAGVYFIRVKLNNRVLLEPFTLIK